MSNGESLNERLEFQERIKSMPTEERITEIALMVYDQRIEIGSLCQRMGTKASKKLVVSFISVIGTFFLGVVIYVLKHIGFPQ